MAKPNDQPTAEGKKPAHKVNPESEAPKRQRGRPVEYTEKRARSHYWVPVSTKEKLAAIADKLDETNTDTLIRLIREEAHRRNLE